MAYSAQPQINSDKTDYYPFKTAKIMAAKNSGTSSTDEVLAYTTNLISNEVDGVPCLQTRPRITVNSTFNPGSWPSLFTTGGSLANIQPSHYYDVETSRFFYSVYISPGVYHLYQWNTVSTSFIASFTRTPVITQFTYVSGARFLFVAGGNAGIYNLSVASWTPVTDPDLPSDVQWPVALDNYVFVVRTGTNDIYQCDFDNPLSWTPGNFITADLTPGLPFYMGRSQNYIAIFKSGGVEFFFNAGNPSGSVLSQYESFFKRMALNNLVTPREFQGRWFVVGADTFNKEGIYSIDTTGMDLVGDDITSSFISLQGTAAQPGRIFFFELYGRPFMSVTRTLVTLQNTVQIFYDMVKKENVTFSFPNTSLLIDSAFVKDISTINGSWWLFDNNSLRTDPGDPLQFNLGQTSDYNSSNIVVYIQTPYLNFGTNYNKRFKNIELVATGTIGLSNLSVTFTNAQSNPLFIGTRNFNQAGWGSVPVENGSRSTLSIRRLPKTRGGRFNITVTASGVWRFWGLSADLEIGTF